MVEYCERAGLIPPERADAVDRLIHASANRFGMSIENIVNAIEEALREGSEALTLAHFARSWGATAAVGAKDNPFVSNEWASIRVGGRAASAFGRFKK